MVVDDLGIPHAGEDAVDVGGFGLIAGEEVAVVIVADVFLPEARHAVELALGWVGVAHVPVGDQLHAVGIGEGAEDDVVKLYAVRLFGELLQVFGLLGVVDELVVVADVMAELLLWGGNVAARNSGLSESGGYDEE